MIVFPSLSRSYVCKVVHPCILNLPVHNYDELCRLDFRLALVRHLSAEVHEELVVDVALLLLLQHLEQAERHLTLVYRLQFAVELNVFRISKFPSVSHQQLGTVLSECPPYTIYSAVNLGDAQRMRLGKPGLPRVVECDEISYTTQ